MPNAYGRLWKKEAHEALAAAEQTVEQLYKRWTELEEKRQQYEKGDGPVIN